MKNIYLDNAATTQIDDRVLEAMLPFLKEDYGNASSVHMFGRKAKVLLEDARDEIAEFIGARSSELYFTSGGTESNNFAIKGVAFGNSGNKKQIISSAIEHSAVIDSLEYLKDRFGFEITYLSNNKFGEIDIEEIRDSIADNTLMLSVMHSNNELGVVNDIKAISELAHEKNILMHSDSVQSIGKTDFKVDKLGCDTATLSAHKIYGPKGIGALFIRKNTPADKFIHGGKQERDRRGGTENIAAIAGFKKAVEILKSEMESDIKHYELLKNKLINNIKKKFSEKIIVNSKEEGNSLNNIVNISFVKDKVNVSPDNILIKLDLAGIAVSSGSACTSGSVQPSHVIKAIGYDDETAKSSIRISFGRFNKESDVDAFISTLKSIIS